MSDFRPSHTPLRDEEPRRRPQPGPRRARRARPGEQPAGRVLAIIVAGLALAALINADALVERAERKPLGPDRDRSLAIWHPVQDVSHILQLHRLRDLGDWLVGGEDPPAAKDPTGSPVLQTTTTLPPEEEEPALELRTPTAEAPLRVLIAGDSIVRDMGESFLRFTADDPLIAPVMHYENATGLTRPDFYDWPTALVQDAEANQPELVILMFGGNDAQAIVAPDGTVHDTIDSPGWRAEYGRRVGGVMDALRTEGRVIVWIGLPPMRSEGFNGRAGVINEVVSAAAAERDWVRFVDTSRVLGDEQGRYVPRLPGVDGELRQGDGIHLARAGADVLARHMQQVVADLLAELAPAPTTTTTVPASTTSTTADDG